MFLWVKVAIAVATVVIAILKEAYENEGVAEDGAPPVQLGQGRSISVTGWAEYRSILPFP